MKKYFYILFLPSLLVSCLIYPAKTKTYSSNNCSYFLYGIEIAADIYGCVGNGGDIPPYQLILSYDIRNSLCKVITFEEIIVNKNRVEYKNNELFSSTDFTYSALAKRYDLPKEFNLDDMEDDTPIYISLKVKFELSDGSIKEEWLGFILYPKFKTQWLNSMFSV